eukprot:CAMPEP_0197537604 /NCGR_PEP_ID=MMETSP1318-20131121/57390_1 /TAXON_ID=552666 /ORGANISM="Partenskyella glossopodia, Strain RCC365" /LENGTH=325 /DNA_ID=CAMNT_0043095807 /DNA_START=83 /DNA_END=1060 /DNA_ORIENTATION=+
MSCSFGEVKAAPKPRTPASPSSSSSSRRARANTSSSATRMFMCSEAESERDAKENQNQDLAAVWCRCGAAGVETAAPIRMSLLCACCDCRQKVLWSMGGYSNGNVDPNHNSNKECQDHSTDNNPSSSCSCSATPDTHRLSRSSNTHTTTTSHSPRSTKPPPQKVQRLFYFENAIIRAKGDLQPILLRQDGKSTFLVAKCCHSILGVSHPAYDGKVFMVLDAAARVSCGSGEVPEPLARIYLKDYDVLERGALPEADCPSFQSDESDVEAARRLYRPFFAKPVSVPVREQEHLEDAFGADEVSLFTMEELISRLPPVQVLGLKEGA